MGTILSFLNTYIAYVRWAVVLFAIIASFWAGHHWASQSCKADQTAVAQAEVKETVKTIEKVKYVQIKNATLPAGAATNELRLHWSRD
jgi:sensor c-di-GMP phosphodiesterase-like protein